MKKIQRRKLLEYRLIILDLDGTLYYQLPLQLCMAAELLVYYIRHISRIGELLMLRRFRKSYSRGILEPWNEVLAYWMEEKPLRYMTLFQDKRLIALTGKLRESGAKIAVYSDFPVGKKIRAFTGLTVDYCFCAADPEIQCLKPAAQGLAAIIRITGEPVGNALFIGDRYEKDGICAEGLGMDYMILDANPLSRNRNVYKKEFSHNDRNNNKE